MSIDTSLLILRTISISDVPIFLTFVPNSTNIQNIIKLGVGCNIAKISDNYYNIRNYNFTPIDISAIPLTTPQ